MRSACPDENLLALLGEDAVDPATRAAIEAHIDRCALCDLMVRELAALGTALDPGSPAPVLPARYRVRRRLGEGGMGVVWAAEDRDLEREVAVKVVRDRDAAPTLRARLLREARLVAAVQHPNVVTVHDVGEHADQVYVAMELVDGSDARAWRAAAPRTTAEVIAVWRSAAAGVVALHAAGVVHRDIKPDNILVAGDGRVVVCDLGLATDVDGVTTLTVTGQALGTPAYMAPEQLRGEPVDARGDQFGWCVAVWEAVTGARPYAGDTVAALALAIAAGPPRAAGEHAAILAVLARGLEPDPARRWPSLSALVAALDDAMRHAGSRPRPARAIGAIAVAGLVMVAAIVIVARKRGGGPSAPGPADAARVTATLAVDATPAATGSAGSAPTGSARPAPVASTAGSVAPTPPRPRPPDTVAHAAAADARPVTAATEPPADYRTLAEELRQLSLAVAEREPARCRRLVAHLVANAATLGAPGVDGLAVMRAECELMNGACAAGRDRYATYLRGQGIVEADVPAGVDDFDMRWCTFAGDGTLAQREKRVMWRLMLAMSRPAPCVDLIDEAEAAGVTPSDGNYPLYAARCVARAGDCRRAETYLPRAATLRAAFEQAHPECAAP